MKKQLDPRDTTYGTASEPICLEYQDSWFSTFVSKQAVTVIIVVINVIFKETVIRLVKWIGYDTHSEQLTKITNGVFVAQFFNTGILILLAFANLDEV